MHTTVLKLAGYVKLLFQLQNDPAAKCKMPRHQEGEEKKSMKGHLIV